MRRSFGFPGSVFVGFSYFPACLWCFSLYGPVSLDTGEAAGEFRFSAAPGGPRLPRAGSREPRAPLLRVVVLPGPGAGTGSRIPGSSERWRRRRRRLPAVLAEGARGGGKPEWCAVARAWGKARGGPGWEGPAQAPYPLETRRGSELLLLVLQRLLRSGLLLAPILIPVSLSAGAGGLR